MAVTILIADDDPQILRALRIILTTKGYRVITAEDGARAMDAAIAGHPDIFLIDLGMPRLDGIALIEAVRGWSQAPILVLSGRTGEADKVRVLDVGADDYVTKPFGMAELVARIRTALRHRVQAEGGDPLFRSGALGVDLVRRRVTVDDTEVKLSPKEYDILRLLVIHAGKVLTHRMIMQEVWGAAGDVQYLRIYIRQLRRKLEANPERPRYILTETGVGYRLQVLE